jgi:hypothetical protein
MATMVLSVAGGLIGGPVGAAVGGLLGNAVDHAVLAPKPREGPRLAELKLQTSSYGTQIPKLFGTLRVAGSVIWATDLIEHRSTSGGGKGRASTTSYSYTASFAVALSARPVLSVGRIWADGKLLRGAGGDFKMRTGFRLHTGSEDQAADPLIVAAEGAGRAPAHRGIAYAVFEDLELGAFGNRIPALTFEVTADPGPVEAGQIAVALGAVGSAEATPALGGFSAQGGSLAAVAAALGDASGGWLADGLLRCGEGAAVDVSDAGGAGHSRGTRAIAAADTAPGLVTLRHYDPARDYQIGVQRAGRGGASPGEAQIELAAAIPAELARGMAEAALLRAELERERRQVTLGWEAIAIPPGARVRIAGAPGIWRVDKTVLEEMAVTLDCVAVAPAAVPVTASGGRVLPAADDAIGATLVHAFELPPLDGALAAVPRLAVAAAGTAPGWRRAGLLLSSDAGASWREIGGTAVPAVLGRLVRVPGAGTALVEDGVGVVEVELAHAGMQLDGADADALAAGANLAMVGDELLQFARAEALGERHWRLSGLWRGRRGTEGAIGSQAVGDRFVLLSRDSLALFDLGIEAIGGRVRVLAEGAGDGAAAEAEAAISGISVLPPAPVHLRVAALPGGGVDVAWVRRGGADWDWSSATTPARYAVQVTPPGGEAAWTVELVAGGLRLPFVPAALAVREVGTGGSSPVTTWEEGE